LPAPRECPSIKTLTFQPISLQGGIQDAGKVTGMHTALKEEVRVPGLQRGGGAQGGKGLSWEEEEAAIGRVYPHPNEYDMREEEEEAIAMV
jgi:hypothetical protein